MGRHVDVLSPAPVASSTTAAPDPGGRRRCYSFDFYKQLVPYKDAWSLQKSLVAKRHVLLEKDEDHSDMLIILQHPPVYTLGTNSTDEFLKFNIEEAPFDVFRTERGGEVTYHGPGQLVMYPIINLRHHKMDLHWYLRSLEEVVIRTLSSFSIKSTRLDGYTGVWVGNQKLAAIGIRVTRWITYHGLALNVNTDLTPFQNIVPCGIRDRRVGSIETILKDSQGEYINDDKLIDVAYNRLLKEFSEVFKLSLQSVSLSKFDLCRAANQFEEGDSAQASFQLT